MPTILRLRSITGGRNRHILSKQHETHNPQHHFVPIRTQGSQQSRRPHVHGWQLGHSHQQWSGTQHIADNKSSDVISRRSQTWRIIYQCQNGSLHAMHSQRNGTSTNLQPHTNRQFNCPHTIHQQIYAQGVEGHGHEIRIGCIATKNRTSIVFTGDLEHRICCCKGCLHTSAILFATRFLLFDCWLIFTSASIFCNGRHHCQC
jgi:hypothetical protein